MKNDSVKSWSLTECRALSVKAARGAGYSWGLAEECGFSACWLEARDAPGLANLAAHLNETEDTPSTCPIKFGTALSDGAVTMPAGSFDIFQPLLLIPFLVQRYLDQAGRIIGSEFEICYSANGVTVDGNVDQLKDGIINCRWVGDAMVAPKTQRSRVGTDAAQIIDVLAKFAHRTYAPSTEESRLAGAGAGLSDND